MTKNQFNSMSVEDKNIELSMAFNRYILEHPEITDQLPPKATIILLPEDDPKLSEINKNIAKSRLKKGDKMVIVKIKEIDLQFKGLSVHTNTTAEMLG